jgi:thioesterase domain-containing protein
MLERMNVFWNSQEHANCFDRCARLISRIRSGIATNIRIKTEVRSAHSVGFTEPHSELRMLQVREAHGISMRSFTPKHLDCRISLFKSRAVNDKFEIPMDYGWGVVVASLDMVEVPGEHLTMFSEENVAILAREVSKRLENNS